MTLEQMLNQMVQLEHEYIDTIERSVRCICLISQNEHEAAEHLVKIINRSQNLYELVYNLCSEEFPSVMNLVAKAYCQPEVGKIVSIY